MIDIKVPSVGESISEVTLLKWTKQNGQYVDRDQVIAEVESEKATFEVNAEQAGVLKTMANEGDTILIGSILAQIDETAVKPEKPTEEAPKAETPKEEKKNEVIATAVTEAVKATPVASAIITDKKVDTKTIEPSGFGGKIMKNDVLEALAHPGKKAFAGVELNTRNVRTEKMSNLRKTISKRLVEAKNTTAMLTTFNEVDMGAIMEIRAKNKDKFKEVCQSK
jgi:2-oxoglutarate dehydrogenase E2 component (dihydrolipoamide succinyltransferase)